MQTLNNTNTVDIRITELTVSRNVTWVVEPGATRNVTWIVEPGATRNVTWVVDDKKNIA